MAAPPPSPYAETIAELGLSPIKKATEDTSYGEDYTWTELVYVHKDGSVTHAFLDSPLEAITYGSRTIQIWARRDSSAPTPPASERPPLPPG